MGHRAAAQSLLAIASKAHQVERRLNTDKRPGGMSIPRSVYSNIPWHGLWITNLHVLILGAPKKDLWGPNNSKFENPVRTGKVVFRRSRRCPKHVRGSDLANRLMTTRGQSQVSGEAR